MTPLSSPVISADEEEGDRLGIPYLRQYWSKKTRSRMQAAPSQITSDDSVSERVLLAGLKIGLRETLDFLMTSPPSFEEFEAWVLTKNEGTISAERVQRLNGALDGSATFALESIQAEPVLSPADLAFWDEHGYVVVKRAVSPEQCQAAVQAIFEYAGMDIDRPESWYKDDIWIKLAHHPALWANRNSGRIHTAFAQLWQRSDLWMDVDVCGVNPPLRPGNRFRGTPLHWDMTLTLPIRFRTQAILYLTDTPANQGAFSCVPGFHRKLESWLRELPQGVDPRQQAVRELNAKPIPGEAGDLIIWHAALPHAATPNHAALPRVVQYLNMFPSQYEVTSGWS